MDYGGLSDEELVGRLPRGDAIALATLYDRFGGLVFSTARRVLGEGDTAADVTQEVFLMLWRTPERFSPARGRFLSWLLTVSRNRAIDEVRRRGRLRRHLRHQAQHMEDLTGGGEDPGRVVEVQEQQRKVRDSLLAIPPEQRQAIELAYFGGLTQREIADHLGEPLGTIKTRIRLGMQKLRAVLAQEITL